MKKNPKGVEKENAKAARKCCTKGAEKIKWRRRAKRVMYTKRRDERERKGGGEVVEFVRLFCVYIRIYVWADHDSGLIVMFGRCQ